MKFIANPDKFIFCIGVGVVGFLFIFSYMILKQIWLLILFLILWTIFSCYLAKKNYVEFVVLEDKFVIKLMNKEYQIDFSDIEYIKEFSDYANPLREKRYELKVGDKLNVDNKILTIENRAFSRWILSQDHSFIIKKTSYL